VFGGKVIRSQIKVGEDGDLPIRNHANGYTFIPFVTKQPLQSRLDTAIEAVAALGLDFGAVDMLCLPDGTERVLEVNTAAACDEPTLLCYLDAIADYTDQEYTYTIQEETDETVSEHP
jgi:glutathione synthase/RimK-type ligase-like ATP-grasp enzyme